MYTTEQLLTLLEQKIASLSMDREPHLLYHPIAYSMQQGGKRVRPILLLMAANMYSDDIYQSIDIALGVEMFHNFTLLHDDIMDNSQLRRGQDTVHKRWNQNVAILSGDAMLIYAYKLLLDRPTEHTVELMSIFNRFSLEICEGQQFDMDFEGFDEITKEQYLNMIRLKTSVLLAGAMEMGAIIGGASKEDCKRLYDFGLNIGLAFQLQDDILDAFGDSATFGKPIGGDIAEGKKSYLTVKCFEICSSEDKKHLIELLHNNNIDRESKISSVMSIYEKYDIHNLCLADVKSYFDKALDIMSNVSVDSTRKEPLLKFSHSLVNRQK